MVVQTTFSNKFIHTKMSIHMLLPVVFIFLAVVSVFEQEMDSLQQHMAIWRRFPAISVSCDQFIVRVTHDHTNSHDWLHSYE